MKDEINLKFAGDLLEEVNEISNIIPEKDDIELISSLHSYGCSTLLTIYCC